MTSGAQTSWPVLHAPTVGSASWLVNVQVAKSGELATGMRFPLLLVAKAYQVPSVPLTNDGSGKLFGITGPEIPRFSIAEAETNETKSTVEVSSARNMARVS